VNASNILSALNLDELKMLQDLFRSEESGGQK
jgi:hypothetical protein